MPGVTGAAGVYPFARNRGDRGGSFISGDQAQGVTSRGWGSCSSGGGAWFRPVNPIQARYGLTPHTA